jgi:hypothetical protein
LDLCLIFISIRNLAQSDNPEAHCYVSWLNLKSIKPETAYFTEQDGKRGGIFVIDVKTPSDVPFFAEPFFLNFQASCKFRILMSPEDLRKAGLDEIGKKWS